MILTSRSLVDPFLVKNFKHDSFYIDSLGTVRNRMLCARSPILFVLYTMTGRLVVVYNTRLIVNKGLFSISERAFYTLEGTELYLEACSINNTICAALGPLVCDLTPQGLIGC